MADSRFTVMAFAGSLREESYNRSLLEAAKEVAPSNMEIEIHDIGDVPLYDTDLEQNGDPEPVAAFKKAIDRADGLLIATPEYQHGISGVLKNALDWASRPPGQSVLQQKPIAILGATTGMTGTARAQAQLRQTLTYNNSRVVQRPEVLVASAQEKFDDEGRLTDEDAKKFIGQLLEALGDLIATPAP